MAAPMAGLQGLGGYQLPQTQSRASRIFKGAEPMLYQIPTGTPQQQAANKQILQMALQGLQNPQAGFAPIAQQARTQFSQQTVPGIAERFSALGSGGAQRSSAFGQQLGAAGAGLEQGLAAQGAQYGLQNQQLLQGLLKMGLMPQFQNELSPGEPGLLQQVGSQILSNLFGGKGLGGAGGGEGHQGILKLLSMFGGLGI